MTDRSCRVCGAPLATPSVGRPPRYCSTTCRRAAEYSLKRLNKHLFRAEWERDHVLSRLDVPKLPAASRRHLETALARVEAAIDRYHAELCRLLDADERISR